MNEQTGTLTAWEGTPCGQKVEGEKAYIHSCLKYSSGWLVPLHPQAKSREFPFCLCILQARAPSTPISSSSPSFDSLTLVTSDVVLETVGDSRTYVTQAGMLWTSTLWCFSPFYRERNHSQLLRPTGSRKDQEAKKVCCILRLFLFHCVSSIFQAPSKFCSTSSSQTENTECEIMQRAHGRNTISRITEKPTGWESGGSNTNDPQLPQLFFNSYICFVLFLMSLLCCHPFLGAFWSPSESSFLSSLS